jgi:hypothetical protein
MLEVEVLKRAGVRKRPMERRRDGVGCPHDNTVD